MGKLVEDLHAIASQQVYQIADLAVAYGIKAEDLWADYIGLMAANTELIKYVSVKGPEPTPKVQLPQPEVVAVKPPRNPIEEALVLGLDARFLESEDEEPEAVEWAKEIPGYSRYKATRDGEIIGVYGQRMNPHIDEGHLKVNIHGDDGKRIMHRVDFLVAKTFMGYNRKPRARVRIEHKDGSPFNCALDNLEVDYGLV